MILPPAPSAPHASTALVMASVAKVVASPTAPQSTILHSLMAVVLVVAAIAITMVKSLGIFGKIVHDALLTRRRVVPPLGSVGQMLPRPAGDETTA